MADLKADALAIFDAAVKAADPAACVRRALEGRSFEDPITVVGAGKAAVPMAQGVESMFPDAQGVVVTRYGHGGETKNIRVLEAGHPVPDKNGVSAAREILGSLRENPVLCLLSGGGSALLTLPVQEVMLSDKQAATDLLLKNGSTIHEINCVRKHLSLIKGGKLARAAKGPVLSLILSDVIGDNLDVIASGPTAPDPTTYAHARDIVGDIEVPDNVRRWLKQGRDETPKPGDPIFDRVENVIVGSNRLALDAAKKEAERLGYVPQILTTELQGETSHVAMDLVEKTKGRRGKLCLLAGGETTVTVTGPGKGGRSQEFALAAATVMKGVDNMVLLAAGTDGTDGETDAAGAIVDGKTATDDASAYLKKNDSYGHFKKQGGLVMTGPTRTNVMDVVVILRDA